MNNLRSININSDTIKERYENGKEVTYEYINIQQGLLNTGIIKIESELMEKTSNKSRIVGIAKASQTHFHIEQYGSYATIEGSMIIEDFNDLQSGAMYLDIVVGIKDNEIVSNGFYITDLAVTTSGLPTLYMKNVPIDSIGFVVNKSVLENKNEYSNDYIILIVDLSESNKRVMGK